MEKHKELVSLVEPLNNFIKTFPENLITQNQVISLQQIAWWLERLIAEEQKSGEPKKD